MAYELSRPMTTGDFRNTVPDARLMSEGEQAAMLDALELALRSSFFVSATTPEADAALIRAMIVAWPSFRNQTRQIALEAVSTDGYSVTYSRAGVIDFSWPPVLAMILGPVADRAERVFPRSVSSSVELVP